MARFVKLGVGVAAGAIAAVGLAAPAFSASTFYLDQLTVGVNGIGVFADNFNTGGPPPTSPPFAAPNNMFFPGYAAFGNFAGAEANGKLMMSPANGLSAFTATGRPAWVQNAILRTDSPISPAPVALTSTDTFRVSALYDYRNPDGPTEHFRLSVTDRVGPQGPGDTTQNAISLAVMRMQLPASASPGMATSCGSIGSLCGSTINPATGQPFTALNGQVAVVVYKQDFVANTVVFMEAHPVDLTGNPDQIRLTLEKQNAGSAAISASFTYVKNGANLAAPVAFSTSALAFQGGPTFTRPEFGAVQIKNVETVSSARLTTGSPASIEQTVSQVTSNTLQFQYRFASTNGALTVTLNGEVLGVLNAPTTLDPNFSTASFSVAPGLIGAVNALLKFTFDSPVAGETLFLDNILFANLANGDFQSGNLSGWTAVSSGLGSVGVELQIQETPLPAALPLFSAGLGLMGFFGWRRRKAARAAQ